MSPGQVYLVSYVAGILVFPFFYSFVDKWPFVRSRMDSLNFGTAFFLSIFWPFLTVAWLVAIWWCGASWLGYHARRLLEAAWGRLRR